MEGASPGRKPAHPKEKPSRKSGTRRAAAASSRPGGRCDRRPGGTLAGGVRARPVFHLIRPASLRVGGSRFCRICCYDKTRLLLLPSFPTFGTLFPSGAPASRQAMPPQTSCPMTPPPPGHRPLHHRRKADWSSRRSLLDRMPLDLKINPPSKLIHHLFGRAAETKGYNNRGAALELRRHFGLSCCRSKANEVTNHVER